MPTNTEEVILTVKLSTEEAHALAQFVKRAHFGTCERLSDRTNKNEPQLMMNSLIALQSELRLAGYAPR